MQTEPVRPSFHIKDEYLSLLFVVACWALALWYYPHLPERVPTHWGFRGQPNAWMDKPWGVILGPLIASGIYLLLLAIPFLDPRRANWAQNQRIYPVLKNVLTGFLVAVTYLSLSAAARPGHMLDFHALILALGLLLMVLGNYLPKVRSNFFLGIRTPWTLSSDAVWERTHRMAGRLFVFGGALIATAAALRVGRQLFVAVIVVWGVLLLFTLVYSWWIYQRTVPDEPPR